MLPWFSKIGGGDAKTSGGGFRRRGSSARATKLNIKAGINIILVGLSFRFSPYGRSYFTLLRKSPSMPHRHVLFDLN